MEYKEDEDFYLKLSKKELQDLCKKHGLPVHKTKFNLARSLVSNMEMEASGDHIHGSFDCFGYNLQETSKLKFKLCDGSGSNGRSEYPSRSSDKNNLGLAKEIIKKGLAKEAGVDNMLESQLRDTSSQLLPKEIFLAPSMKYAANVPTSSFEFHVSSEQGIQLCVDLNSNPSDWTSRLKSEVRICDIIQNHKTGLQEELGGFGDINKPVTNFFPLSTDSCHEYDDSHQIRFPSSLPITEQRHGGVDHLGGNHGSLRSSPVQPCGNAVDIQRHLKECQKLVLSSRPSYVGTVSSAKNEEAFGIHHDTLLRKPACTSAAKSSPNGVRSPHRGEHRDSNNNHNCENLVSQVSCSPIKPGMIFPRSLVSEAKEMVLSGVHHKDASSPCEYAGFLNMVHPVENLDSVHNGLATSGELNRVPCCNNLPASAEERERSNFINGMEISDSMVCDNSVDMIGSRSDNSESSVRVKRKWPHNDDQDSDGCELSVQVLKNPKHSSNDILRRRSMRLVSK